MGSRIDTLAPRLKEILYRCLEDIRATKAALYVLGNSPESYSLVSQYGFREAGRREVGGRDEMIDRLVIKRAPFFVNGLREDPRFSELLFSSDTTRMLVSPIYSRRKLVGFVDMRDKAGGEPFTAEDVSRAGKISEQFLELFASENLFGEPSAPPVATASVEVFSETDPGPASEPVVPAARSAINEARRAIARGVIPPQVKSAALSETQIDAAGAVLPQILAMPAVVMASFTAFGEAGGQQVIVSRAELAEATVREFHGRLRSWAQKRGGSDLLRKSRISHPLGAAGAPLEPAHLASMLSAPVRSGSIPGLVLTVVFDSAPGPEQRTLLRFFLQQIQMNLERAGAYESWRTAMRAAAASLLEPDLERYPDLAAHSERVSDLAERLARHVGLPDDEIEKVRLAGAVHDVGMRLLEYESLYRKRSPTSEELRILREHPAVGAVLVARSPLGTEIARIVLSHHERPDGTGYPSALPYDSIPIGSRIIHLCESYDAMTSSDSYQSAMPRDSALARIDKAAGTQFDRELAQSFAEMMQDGPARREA